MQENVLKSDERITRHDKVCPPVKISQHSIRLYRDCRLLNIEQQGTADIDY